MEHPQIDNLMHLNAPKNRQHKLCLLSRNTIIGIQVNWSEHIPQPLTGLRGSY